MARHKGKIPNYEEERGQIMPRRACPVCRKEKPEKGRWFVCGSCGFRVCHSCLSKNEAVFGPDGMTCNQCPKGKMKEVPPEKRRGRR